MSRLIVAIPSKGRLEENTARIFGEAGVGLIRENARGYRGKIEKMDNAEIVYLSAGEIALALRDGKVHLGVTGEDLLREEVADMDSAIALLTPLGFGHADVVVAVPDLWVDVRDMSDLAEVAGDMRAQNNQRLRVATKYINLTQDFFAVNGVSDYTIVKSFGATEGAPASGAAEIIVDISSSGETLRANGLRVLDDGVILKSAANLAASLNASWPEECREAARQICAHIRAGQISNDILDVQFSSGNDDVELINILCEKFAARIPFEDKQPNHKRTEKGGEIRILIDKTQIGGVAHFLHQRGRKQIIARRVDYIFGAQNPFYDTLQARLP